MKGSTTVMENSKFENILKERNAIISHYKERCDGLEEINKLLGGLIYCLIKSGAEKAINKESLRSSIRGGAISLCEDNENYYVSIDDTLDSSSVCDEDGKAKV